MGEIVLNGSLICKNVTEREAVEQHLPRHVALTRAEAGCLSFDVSQTSDPMVWTVAERFVDSAAFAAHQARVATSDWGRATAGITRDYVVQELSDPVLGIGGLLRREAGWTELAIERKVGRDLPEILDDLRADRR